MGKYFQKHIAETKTSWPATEKHLMNWQDRGIQGREFHRPFLVPVIRWPCIASQSCAPHVGCDTEQSFTCDFIVRVAVSCLVITAWERRHAGKQWFSMFQPRPLEPSFYRFCHTAVGLSIAVPLL